MPDIDITRQGKPDLDYLREKYRQERDVRLREDGSGQYKDVSGKYTHFDVDPYVPYTEREPLTDSVDVIVVGGGWSGIMAAAKLKQAGVERVRVVEKGGDFGGVWYWNRYPGAQCDIESYIYVPLLDDTGYMPTEKYVFQPELFAYAQSLGKKFDLYNDAVFSTELTEIAWDDLDQVWVVKTNRGDQMRATYVVMTSGVLDRPKLPGIPGIDEFKGPHLPHQPVGLQLHRRGHERKPDRAGRQEGRHPRHRGDRYPEHPRPRCFGWRTVCLSAHAVRGARAQQPSHR